ncbi:DUF3955 domain-containing protein [Enterococcus sp. AZ172]|uniref:DUF3955 domain-containing protein n=1 Tax=unclassified Enterococcus TaxID=2608891 RepID=UPI003F248A74
MKSYTISIIFFNIGLLLFAPHSFVGSYVDSIGILVEPAFFCIPLGYLSFMLSIFPQCIASPEISSTKKSLN